MILDLRLLNDGIQKSEFRMLSVQEYLSVSRQTIVPSEFCILYSVFCIHFLFDDLDLAL